MKRATIADVAQYVGVSKSTVSHAISGNRPISAETRARIQQAIAELGYQPHPVAQRLANRQMSRTIGLIYPLYSPNITSLETKFIASAASVINQADYAFLLLTHAMRDFNNLQRMLRSGIADGYILMQVRLRDPRIAMLQNTGLPFVLIGRASDNTDLAYVDVDIARAMTRCVEHLAALKHRAVAYLHQNDPEFGFIARAQQSFTNACQRHRIAAIMQSCELSPDSGNEAMHELLDRHPNVTAIIVWSESAAWGAAQAARDHGRNIPQDLSLICFDCPASSKLVTGEPTVVDIRAEELVALSARMLINMLEDQPNTEQQVLLQPGFIEGASTALTSDPDV